MSGLINRISSGLLLVLLAGGISACSINEGDGTAPTDIGKCGPDSSQSTKQITLSGQITYDRVPADGDFTGLDYSATTPQPVRRVRIAAVCGTETFATGETDSNGNYSLQVPNNTDFILRVRAYLAGYEFKVVDNTSDDALYVLDSSIINAASDQTLNLNAASGWTGTGYTEPRAAAPFAILDSALTAALKVTSVDPDEVFPPLELNWSSLNKPAPGQIDMGQIGTTYYQQTSEGSAIYILGEADTDTDEYDDHVIIHEWGHYLEDRFSRSDSLGGPHSGNSKLDMRVAYGEGFGNAWSAIATDDPVYFDTLVTNQDGGFSFNMESSESLDSIGWYSETSVQRLLWDFYDQDSVPETTDTMDTMGLGLAPLYAVWVNDQKNTPTFTSIYSFAWALHDGQSSNPAAQTWIVNLLEGHNIFGDTIWGENETNSPDITKAPEDDGLPVYQTAMIDGPMPDACSDKEYNEYNKSTNRQFYRIKTGILPQTVTITVSDPASTGTDPDFRLYKAGEQVVLSCTGPDTETCGQSPDKNSETASVTFEADKEYVLAVYRFENVDLDTATGGRTCYTVQIQATP